MSAGFFEVLGVPPLEGRWFLPEEDQPGREHVVILSHRLWRSRFGGDRSIVGRPILLDGVPYTVVGIMGPAFDYPDWAQLWTPLAWTEKERAVRGEHSCLVVARLAPGEGRRRRAGGDDGDLAGARAEYPEDNKGWGAVVVPLREDLRRRRPHVAAGAARRGGVRAAHRVRERRQPRAGPHARRGAARWPSASRSAPGAGRIVRQVLTETTAARASPAARWACSSLARASI